jgi:pentatricopeptide repeat protein
MRAAVREASLPDGLQSLLAEFDNFEDDVNEGPMVELQDVTTRLFDQLSLTASRDPTSPLPASSLPPLSPPSSKELSLLVTPEEVNAALLIAGQKGSKKTINSYLLAMETLQIPLEAETVTALMKHFIQLKEFSYVEMLFEKSLDLGTNPNSDTWAAFIRSQASQDTSTNITDALATMSRIIRIGVVPTIEMYLSVLEAYLLKKQHKEAFEYWMQMKAEGVPLTVEAYNLMLQHTVQTYSPERAFLYFDEMKGVGRRIQPNSESYAKLFEVCGSAPMWVNGYQDIIFDAMALMEGAEYPPSTEIYNSIIKSFGQGADSNAAEFYFWEMRQKGIPQTTQTYNNLFGALAR